MRETFRKFQETWKDGTCPACFARTWRGISDQQKKVCWVCNNTRKIDKDLLRLYYIDKILPDNKKRHKANIAYDKEQKRLKEIEAKLTAEEWNYLRDLGTCYCDKYY